MKRFRFRLARVERLRRHREAIARRELAARLSTVAALDRGLATVAANLEACGSEEGAGRALGAALVGGLGRLERRLVRRREGAIADAEIARAQYVERRRDVQALTRLREQRFAAWRTEVERSGQAELDELARMMFAAKETA